MRLLRRAAAGALLGSAACAVSSVPPGPLYAYSVPVPSVKGGYAGVMVQSVFFDGNYIWTGVQDGSAGVVRKLDLNGRVLATAQVGVAPLEMAYDGSKLWVADYVSSDITVIDRNGVVVKTIPMPGLLPEGLLYDGKYIWAANNAAGANSVSKYDAATLRHIADYRVGGGPDGFAFDGTYIWVTNSYSNTVMKLDRESGAVLRTYPTDQFPLSVVYDGHTIWVGNGTATGGSLSALRAAGGVTLGQIPLGHGVRGLVFDGSSVWACNSLDNTVSVVRASDGAITGTYQVGSGPRSIAFDGTNLWIANSQEGSLTVVTPNPSNRPSLHQLVDRTEQLQTSLRSGAALSRGSTAQLGAMLNMILGDD
jgi:YVTN family beta-propeller protein